MIGTATVRKNRNEFLIISFIESIWRKWQLINCFIVDSIFYVDKNML